MDLNNFWQENKRFVVTIVSGAIVFVIGSMVVDSFFKSSLQQQEREASTNSDKLRNTPMYGSAELQRAEEQNAALVSATERLSNWVEFKTRPRFQLDATKGPAANQYFTTVAAVREELLRAAGRANLRLPDDLGLPALSPTREVDIQKTLEALDLVERAVRIALESGVERIERIEIKPDPGLASRAGVGEIERTRVSFVVAGAPQPLVRMLFASQGRSPEGALALLPLVIERADLVPTRNKADEATLDLVLCVVRLHPHSSEDAPAPAKPK